MRIAVAEIAQETDSFSPLTADLKDFESNGLYFGHEILERMPGVGPVGGFLDVAAEQMAPVELLPIIRAWEALAEPSAKKPSDSLPRVSSKA